jgi:hypothetical protein
MTSPNSYHPILALARVAIAVSPAASVSDAQRAVVTLRDYVGIAIVIAFTLAGISLIGLALAGKIWNERNEQ